MSAAAFTPQVTSDLEASKDSQAEKSLKSNLLIQVTLSLHRVTLNQMCPSLEFQKP